MIENVKKASMGDKEAFTELINYMKVDLYKIARCKLNNEDDICDAIQNTMISAYKSIIHIKNYEYFKTWIIRILINECNKIYLSKENRNISYDNDEQNFYIGTDDSEINEVESKMTFDSIISVLPEEDREIMILFYNNDYSTKEISKIINKNENTIKTKIRRSKEKIREVFYGGKCVER